ncbi:hypothetical protein [[Flexibacter] sp. ATCC 35208]|uniref:hypothetical protein n=1 Tax=[Flexibacter] sp. ATCC 35208 TaxID=1936242 RepID=UPI00117F1BB7|nr:hypothetical protein [[Flexibacter] sp. ATCC 35208]
MGEEALAMIKQSYKPTGKGSSLGTSLGARYVDVIPIGTHIQAAKINFEVKVGLQEFSGNVANQIAKDEELLALGKVEEITWVFFRSPVTGKIGPSARLLTELQ